MIGMRLVTPPKKGRWKHRGSVVDTTHDDFSSGETAVQNRSEGGRIAEWQFAGHFEWDGRTFEEIVTLKRLSDVTATVHGGFGDCTVSYSSLTADRYRLAYRADLPEEICFFRKRVELLEHDPRELTEETHTVMVPETRTKDVLLETVASVFTPPTPEPKGVDVLVRDLRLDVRDLNRGEGRDSASQG